MADEANTEKSFVTGSFNDPNIKDSLVPFGFEKFHLDIFGAIENSNAVEWGGSVKVFKEIKQKEPNEKARIFYTALINYMNIARNVCEQVKEEGSKVLKEWITDSKDKETAYNNLRKSAQDIGIFSPQLGEFCTVMDKCIIKRVFNNSCNDTASKLGAHVSRHDRGSPSFTR